MNIRPGTIIKSTSALNNSFFEDAVILITVHNNQGAAGFVINKIFDRPLNALQEFSHLPPFPIYEGGPVDTEHLFFIHRRPDLVNESNKICDGIFSGGNFKQAVDAIQENSLSASAIKIFIGYCGWDYLELEAEIEEGSWEITAEEPGIAFN